MSTKINVRSPFYLNLTEPSVPEPTFTCEVANIKNLTIDQQGQINTPDLDYGIVLSITSSDSDFSNDKFSTVSTATNRDIVVRVSIPSGFSNVTDGFLDCAKTVEQPAYVVNTTCSDGPTTNGSVPAQTIAVNGGSATINLASYFTQGTLPISSYSIYNPKPTLISASESGGTLTISSSNIGGSTNLQVSASDSGTNTCTATQTISVTVSAPTLTFACIDANFRGGAIAQDGTITKPNSVAAVGTIKSSSGGSAITSYSANNTGSARSVTLYFDLTVPAGYSNAGSTVECDVTFTQPAGDPEFTCDVANLSGQQISEQGIINVGTAQIGTIASFSPLSFSSVSTKTTRQVTFNVTPPATGYSNSGGSAIACVKNIPQPAFTDPCGTNDYVISLAQPNMSAFCTGLFTVSKPILSTATDIETARGETVCFNGSPMLGGSFFYAVNSSPTQVGTGTGRFVAWKINDEGLILEVAIHTCPDDGSAPDGLGILV